MKSSKKLRVFEAFAGIGAQAAALKRLNINYEIVGITIWESWYGNLRLILNKQGRTVRKKKVCLDLTNGTT